MPTPQQTFCFLHRLRQHRTVSLLGALMLLIGLSALPGRAAPEEVVGAPEALIIAVDVSRSMRTRLPAVKRAVQVLVDGLDLRRQYRAVLVRFGTTTEQVVELDLDGEVARRVFQSAVQDLRADQQWTHFDELLAYLQRKAPDFGTGRISTLLYSDGLCSIKPGSGKRCPDLASLGTLVPLSGFNLYLVRITSTPHPRDAPATAASGAAWLHVIEAKLEALTDITRGIGQRLAVPHTSPVPEPAHVSRRMPESPDESEALSTPAPRQAPAAPPAPVGGVREVSAMSLPRTASGGITSTAEMQGDRPPPESPGVREKPRKGPGTLLILLGLSTMGGILGILWWHWHFRPFTLVLTLDGQKHEVLIDTVSTVVRLGPTLGCDVLDTAMPAPCHLLVQRQALQFATPTEWGVWSGETQQLPVDREGAVALYHIVYGELLRLTTSGGEHYLIVEHAPSTPTTKDDESSDVSPLHILGIR